MSVLFLVLKLSLSVSYSQEKNIVLDPFIHKELKRHNITALEVPKPNPNRKLIELGQKLFSDPILSGNKRISCQTCHNPATGTSDTFPMSQSENGKNILRRNAPALFNIGAGKKAFMFWDGRVAYDREKKVFTTPENALNGEHPQSNTITETMTSPIAAQALFPMVSEAEMLGKKGENDIADSKNNIEAWEKIVSRLKKNKTYHDLFLTAYPQTPIEKINIGHVSEAIASFESEQFSSTGSPFQHYLRGDNAAMTNEQKRGLVVFLGSGKCINCHTGSELGNNSLFASVSVPDWGAAPLVTDKGRGDIIKKSAQNFFFKVPSLLNVALSAPYMHNGAYQTLGEVIDHYDYVSEMLNNFEVSNERREKIPVAVEIEKNPARLDEIWLSSQGPTTPKLENRLFLTPLEKKYLEIFLREALTDPKWKK
jgi:cytochrome c peroxidase